MKVKPPGSEITVKMEPWEAKELLGEIERVTAAWDYVPPGHQPTYPLHLQAFAEQLKEAMP